MVLEPNAFVSACESMSAAYAEEVGSDAVRQELMYFLENEGGQYLLRSEGKVLDLDDCADSFMMMPPGLRERFLIMQQGLHAGFGIRKAQIDAERDRQIQKLRAAWPARQQ